MKSIVLILCLYLTFAKWDLPIVFMKKKNFEYCNMFIDDEDNSLNIVARDNNTLKGYYLKIISNEIVYIEQIPIKIPSSFRFHISGKGNGKNLYIAFISYNEYDIFFMESDTGGKYWTNPVKINKKKTKCFVNSLVYEPETGRLFMEHDCYPNTDDNNAYFISRPPDSSLFTDELLIYTNNTYFFKSAITYTLKKGKPFYHVFMHINFRVIYTQSENNGITWSIPRVIEDITTNCKNCHIKAESSPKISDYLFLFYQIDDETYNKIGIVYSKNNGTMFSKPRYFDADTYDLRAQFSKDDKEKLLAFKSFKSKYTHLKGWENDKLTIETFTTPFSESAYFQFDFKARKSSTIKMTFIGHLNDDITLNAIANDILISK